MTLKQLLSSSFNVAIMILASVEFKGVEANRKIAKPKGMPPKIT